LLFPFFVLVIFLTKPLLLAYLSTNVTIKPMKPDKTLDCLGLFCPEPVFKTRMALDEMKVGQTLEITADDPAAKPDLENLAKNLGQQVLESKIEDGVTRVIIKKVK
jgi:tRNA 2-thiouridine synthesizing protein A